MTTTGGTDMAQVMALMRQGNPMQATALIQQGLGIAPMGDGALRPAATTAPGLKALPAPLVRARTEAPDGMVRHSHSGPHGARDYLLFTPDAPAQRPALVVVLHGCTQDAADIARGTGMNALAARRGWHVAYPEQTAAANMMRCWNWFEPAHQQTGAGEPALLAGLIADALAQAGLAAEGTDVFVAGMSAGGAMAAVLAETYPGLIRAAGVHSGLPAGAAAGMPQAMQAMKSGPAGRVRVPLVPMIVFHGSSDQTVAPANGRALGDALGRGGAVYHGTARGGLAWTARKAPQGEYWQVNGLGHAWSGGAASGTFTDARGPDASAEMLRFFAERRDG